MKDVAPVEAIAGRIKFLRGHGVLLDKDPAEMYGVETKVLLLSLIHI